jgi:exopolysaccharide biosynthesis protein
MGLRMLLFLKKPYRWAATYTIILLLATSLLLLDTFVIPRAGTPVAPQTTQAAAATTAAATTADLTAGASTAANAAGGSTAATTATGSAAATTAAAIITSTSYQDAQIQITVETVRQYDTTFYVADIRLASADYLKTAFANNTYGRNIKAATSSIAAGHNAILAINGDYYGFRDYGFVLRNGVLYRAIAKDAASEALAVTGDGDFQIIQEKSTTAQALADAGIRQVFSFGPTLVHDGEITVDANDEVGQSMSSNPRTAIGQISPLHYIFIVSDGRTAASAGLSLLQLAQEFAGRGCTVAYNLDGGGSSTMVLNGQVINNPTDGRSSGERSVSDIVYIGY